jgi:hypothetical protein
MEEWFNWLAESQYNPIGLDTGDAMFQYVSDAVCKRMGVKAPHEIDHGVAWTDIFNEMRRLLGILLGADKGVVVLMHIYMIERRIKGGGIINTATFNIGCKSQRFLASIANQILHFTIEPGADGEDHHIIVSRPRSGVEAGDQWGLLPESIDRGKSPEEGAKSLLSCFYEL